RQGRVDRVAGRGPVRVAGQLDVLARDVRGDLVRAAGDHVRVVVQSAGRRVLVDVDRDRRGLRQGQHVRELAVLTGQVEHQGGVVRGVDAGQAEVVGRLVLVRTRVGAVGEQRGEVLRTGRVDRVDRVGALDRVLDFLGGDRLTVGELQPGADLDGPGQAVRRGGRSGRRQAGDQLRRLRAGGADLVGHQRARVVPGEVPGVRVVLVDRVHRVKVLGAAENERTALVRGRVDHAGDTVIELDRVGRVGGTAAAAALAATARGSDRRDQRGRRGRRGDLGCTLHSGNAPFRTAQRRGVLLENRSGRF